MKHLPFVRRRGISDRWASPVQKALDWLDRNCLPSGGLRAQTGHPNSYPEVSGYTVPTLLAYGNRELATALTHWLVAVQRPNGAFWDPDLGRDFVFDTGQVLRGLLAASTLVPQARQAAGRAADWLLAQVIDGGQKGFPATYDKTNCPETVHLYVLPALVQAAETFQDDRYRAAAEQALDWYLRSPELLDLDDLTHFLAYEIEALLDLGRLDVVHPVLDRLKSLQESNGAIRGQGGARWVCTPGLAQIALCWYKTGDREPADRAMQWLEKHQEDDGGFRGSYGPKASYKETVQIPWAVKFFLDAHRLRTQAFFAHYAGSSPSEVSATDGRLQAILAKVAAGDSVVEIGCGKGRFLKAIQASVGDVRCVSVDLSPTLLAGVPGDVCAVEGTLEQIPLPTGSYDVVFSVEAIEHSSDLRRSVLEMVRVAKPGGWVVIVDKQRRFWGRLETPSWERWPDIAELQEVLQMGCDQVTAEPVSYDGNAADGLMVAWSGRKRGALTGAEWHHALVIPHETQEAVDAVRFGHLSQWAQMMLLETNPGESVLEIGSGTGRISLQLAIAGRDITCLDTSAESLKFTRRCADALSLTIHTVEADATCALPFEDGAFDCVWNSGLLEHFTGDQRQAMLREWARVCRRKLIVLVPNASCLAYRVGKMLQERRGLWPYGLEMPLATLRDDFAAAHLRVLKEFSVAPRHALEFLPSDMKPLREILERMMQMATPAELADWNQGYLLVTVGTPCHGGDAGRD